MAKKKAKASADEPKTEPGTGAFDAAYEQRATEVVSTKIGPRSPIKNERMKDSRARSRGKE